MRNPIGKSAPWEQAVFSTQMFHRFKFCFPIPCNKTLTRRVFCSEMQPLQNLKQRLYLWLYRGLWKYPGYAPLILSFNKKSFIWEHNSCLLKIKQQNQTKKSNTPPQPQNEKNKAIACLCSAMQSKAVWHLAWLCWDHSRGADLNQWKLEVLDGLLLFVLARIRDL